MTHIALSLENNINIKQPYRITDKRMYMNTENVIELINRARKKLERIDDDNCYSLSMDIDKLLDFALKELKDE